MNNAIKISLIGVFCVLCSAYFLNSLVYGKKWRREYKEMLGKYAQKEQELEALEEGIHIMQTKIAKMKEGSLDKDLVELQIKTVLHRYKPSEIVISK